MKNEITSGAKSTVSARNLAFKSSVVAFMVMFLVSASAGFALSSITVTAPNGGEKWGGIHSITSTSDCVAGENVNIYLVKETPASSSAIALGTDCSAKTYSWNTVGKDDGSDYKVRIESTLFPTGIYDYSNNFFTIDNTAPTTTSSLSGTSGTNGWYISNVQVTLSASDTTSGVNATKYKIDNGAEQTYSSAFPISDEGTHTLYYWSVDAAGNIETAHTITVKIDKTAPVITVNGNNPATIEYGNTYADAGATVTDNLDTTVVVVPSGSVNTGVLGDNTITYDATDVAGNHAIQKTRLVHVVQRPITVTAVTNTKTYDGTTTSTGAPTITSGSLAPSDTATWTQTFDNKNVGAGKTLTPAGSVGGGKNGNYIVTFEPVNTGVINTASLTVTGITANNKVYYGNTDATLDTGSAALVGVIAGDVVTLDKTVAVGAFGNKHVGTGKSVTISGLTITGADSGNYHLIQPTTTADITKRAITVTATTNTKTYDGTFSASAPPTVTIGSLAAGDTLNFVEAYETKTVGTSKTLIPSGFVNDGNDGNNYVVTSVNDNTGVINAASVTVSATADNEIYDGNTNAVAHLIVNGVIGADVVTASGTASFNDANVGTGKAVKVTGITLSGADSGNYVLSSTTASTTASIIKKAASVTPNAASKTYGDSNPALTGTLNGFIGTDSVTATYNRVSGENVGSYDISATLGPAEVLGNYDITYNTATFAINTRPITVIANAQTKIYGDPDPALTYTFIGSLVGSDVFTGALTRDSGENVRTYAITQGTLSLSSNYVLTYSPSTLTITPKTLTITANDRTKTYGDAVTFAGTEFTTNGLVGSDSVTGVTLTSAGEGASATVFGSPYDIVPSNAVGTGLGNYAITYTNGKLTVNKATPVISVTGGTFEYDGNSHPATGSVTGVLGENLDTPTFTYNGSSSAPVNLGTYSVVASFAGNINYNSATNTATIVIRDTTAPSITYYVLSKNATSPRAESNKETTIALGFSETAHYIIEIVNSSGSVVTSWTGDAKNPGNKTWDGKSSGVYVPNDVYTIKITLTDPSGNTRIDTTKTIRVYDFVLNLNNGWNLVSVPKALIGDGQNAFSGAVWAYDASSSNLWYTPTTIEPGHGYWVSSTGGTVGLNYKTCGEPTNNPCLPNVALPAGWNLIGHMSDTAQPINESLQTLSGKYSFILRSNKQTGEWEVYKEIGIKQFTNIEPGTGYWIYMNEEGEYANI